MPSSHFFAAPMEPRNLSVKVLPDLRSISISFEPPESGMFSGFHIEIYELDSEGAEIHSEQNVLDDDSPSNSLNLTSAELTAELKLAKFATVYKLKVRTSSENGQLSIRYAGRALITGK